MLHETLEIILLIHICNKTETQMYVNIEWNEEKKNDKKNKLSGRLT